MSCRVGADFSSVSNGIMTVSPHFPVQSQRHRESQFIHVIRSIRAAGDLRIDVETTGVSLLC